MEKKENMVIYPAIDMKDGRCVRLKQGAADAVTVYGDDPVAMAEKWAAAGAKWLHVVDLDGAFEGKSRNAALFKQIVEAAKIPVQTGGGIRTMADIAYRIEECGIARVILGTAALENPGLVAEAAKRFPGKIAVGIDAKDGYVAVRGWVDVSKTLAVDLAQRMARAGACTVIYTDISKDGMMRGPNVEATGEMVREGGMPVIGSGGVSCLEDVRALKAAGCAGVIVGQALYSGAVTLEELLALGD